MVRSCSIASGYKGSELDGEGRTVVEDNDGDNDGDDDGDNGKDEIRTGVDCSGDDASDFEGEP